MEVISNNNSMIAAVHGIQWIYGLLYIYNRPLLSASFPFFELLLEEKERITCDQSLPKVSPNSICIFHIPPTDNIFSLSSELHSAPPALPRHLWSQKLQQSLAQQLSKELNVMFTCLHTIHILYIKNVKTLKYRYMQVFTPYNLQSYCQDQVQQSC